MRFDSVFGIEEKFEDLVDLDLVEKKENFVRGYIKDIFESEDILNNFLQKHVKSLSNERLIISDHQQNWPFEIILYKLLDIEL